MGKKSGLRAIYIVAVGINELCCDIVRCMIEFDKPTLTRRDMNAVLETMVDERIGPGERLLTLKGKLCRKFRTGRAEVLSTFPAALCYAVEACGAEKGSSVLVSPLTCISRVRALERAGYHVVIGDIDGDTKILSYESVEKHKKAKLAVVLLEDILGAAPIDERWKSCPVPVIEDITYSLKGSCGQLQLLSLEEGSPVCGATGGAVMFVKWMDNIEEPESSLRLPDLNSALAAAQLDTLETRMERIGEIRDCFRDAALRSRSTVFPTVSRNVFAVEAASKPADVIDYCRRYGVTVRLAFGHSVGYGDVENNPSAMGTLLRTLRFPLYYFLRQDEVETVSRVIASLH